MKKSAEKRANREGGTEDSCVAVEYVCAGETGTGIKRCKESERGYKKKKKRKEREREKEQVWGEVARGNDCGRSNDNTRSRGTIASPFSIGYFWPDC